MSVKQPPIQSRIVGHGTADPAALVANPRNWRTHPPEQLAALTGELDRVGWVQSVIVNRTTGHLVDGHLRVKVAADRGDPSIPVVYVELSLEEEARVLVALDPLGSMAGTNDALLQDLMDDVDLENQELEQHLVSFLAGGRTGSTEPDDVPDVPEGPAVYVQPGDLWLLGHHRLLCGDSTKAEDVARLLDGARVSLVATDPPYGVDYSGVVAGRANQRKGGWADISGDVEPQDGPRLTRSALGAIRQHTAPGCAVLVWHPTQDNAWPFRQALQESGVHILKQIIWVKPTLVFGRSEYHWRHEVAMYGWFEGSRANFYGERSETTVWEVAPSPSSKVRNGPAMATGGLGEHPTQKPVELYAIPIRNHTKPGEWLYEPFSGSGSGIIAAESEGRRCAAIDVEPRYVQVAIERWQAFTGKQATRVV